MAAVIVRTKTRKGKLVLNAPVSDFSAHIGSHDELRGFLLKNTY